MYSRHALPALLIPAILATAACAPPPPDDARRGNASAADTTYMRSVFGPTWTLTRLNGAAPPAGSGGRPATLQFYSGSERRANGFAGCNQWSSAWERGGRDTLRFAPPVATRMACAAGMELEQRFLALITGANRFSQRDSTLTLRSAAGDSAVFVAR